MRKDEGRTAENGKGSSQEMRGEQSERLEGGGRELEQQGSSEAK